MPTKGNANTAPEPGDEPTAPAVPVPAPVPAPAPPPSAVTSGASWRLLFWAAIVIVVVYVGFVLLAFNRADDELPETDWSRSVYVLLGVEAIAFTAVGWLFGREVHRGEAKVAEKHADEAKQDARLEKSRAEAAQDHAAQERSRAEAAETKGRVLANAVHSLTEPEAEPAGGDERGPAEGRTRGVELTPPSRAADALRNLADQLFPSD